MVKARSARLCVGVVLAALVSASRLAAKTIEAPPVEADGVVLTLSIEEPDDGAIVQEMLTATLKASFRDGVMIAKIEDPASPNAFVERLGRDVWTRAAAPLGSAFERRLAVFPQKSGPFLIEPFVVQATVRLLSGDMRHLNLRSAPLLMPVRAAPSGVGNWWLPARAVRITDEWEPDPETLPAGTAARRTVTIEADGITVAQLPPMPSLRAPGVITFAHPAETAAVVSRERSPPLPNRTALEAEAAGGFEGPRARAVYRWDVRSQIAEPALLKAIDIVWFDTVNRELRRATIPARRVVQVAAPPPPERAPGAFFPPRPAVLAAAAGGFGLGLAVLLLLARLPALMRSWRAAGPARAALARMRSAARQGDAQALRAAVWLLEACELRDDAAARFWRAAPDVAVRLAGLDRSLYAGGEAGRPNLAAIDRAVRRARRGGSRLRLLRRGLGFGWLLAPTAALPGLDGSRGLEGAPR